MEVEIPQQALGKALARGIATDSPAFLALGKAWAKKIAQIFLLFNRFTQFQHRFNRLQSFQSQFFVHENFR